MDSYKLETTFKDLNLGKHFAAAKEAEKFENKLASYQIEFEKLEIDFDNWENIRKGSNYQIKELNDKILKFKSDMLLNHFYTFESNKTLFDAANNASKIIAKKASIEKG